MLKRFSLYLLTLALVVISYSSALGQSEEKKNAYGLPVDNTASLESQFASVQELSKEVVKRVHGRGPNLF